MDRFVQGSVAFFRRMEDVRLLAAVIALVVVFIAVNKPNTFNKDGILYLEAAEAFADKGLDEAMSVYRWPFYPIAIALVGKLTHLPMELTAHALNALLCAVVVTSFITILKEMGASKSVQVLGSIIVLSHPRLQHYHHYISRDYGYWAFLLLSLVQMMRYYHQLYFRHALGWGFFITMAALFRPEGFVLMFFSPLVLLFRTGTGAWGRLGGLLKPYGLFLVFILLGGIWELTRVGAPPFPLSRFGEFLKQLTNGLAMVNENLNAKAAIATGQLLPPYLTKFSRIMIISGLAGIFFYQFITALYPLHVLLLGYGIGKAVFPDAGGSKKVIYVYVLLSLVIPAVYLYQKFILSHRFLMPSILLLLLWVPFSVHHIFQLWQNRPKGFSRIKIIFPLMAAWLLVMFVYILIPPRGLDSYILDAGTWLKTHMPPDASLYTNEVKLAYYAKRKYKQFDVLEKSKKGFWGPGDYIALKVYPKDYENVRSRLAAANLTPIKTMKNKEGRRVVIVKIANP
ncbi:hypothetical protein [Desulfosarcina ovata]|uniref:Glycosyltransferase RgtA/B/C/D-like domain-containing protein n=1 Tax=Desulfosarcina ovata subsp. ovata TaxID=2752305 RepID=A0A5K8A5R4_9BACT|nr:hypothetical protein [Desulfosarcina ovata]BBO87796.1 hypothetical protein DSCOOX_09760 [Desulfosarcina ovata subsp. ovata]